MPNSPELAQLFRSRSLLLTERILGLCDRNPESETAGCCDRHYWCYKLHDMANARCQETVSFLVQATPHLAAPYRPAILDLTRRAISFWAERRHPDGSVDEIHPYERSFCATAMSAQAVAQAWLLLENPPEVDFVPTARWLGVNDNPGAPNQTAGACLALERIAGITGDTAYSRMALKKFQRIARRQLANGCYAEYGGPDVGYATITLSLLAGYHALTGSAEVLDSMRRCEQYLLKVVDEQGLYAWEKTSRRTQFLYPGGLAYLESELLSRLTRGLEHNVVLQPLWMDDRYCVPMAADYLWASECLSVSVDGRAEGETL